MGKARSARSSARCWSGALGHGERLNAEAPDELAVRLAVIVGFEVALVPGDAERLIRHLDHEEIEVGLRR